MLRFLKKLWDVKFIRFIIIGGVNTLFGYGMFTLFKLMGLNYILAILFATLLGVLFNFVTTGRIVFENRENGLILKFIAVYAVVYAVNVGLATLLKRFDPGRLIDHPWLPEFLRGDPEDLNDLVAQAFCMPVIVTLGFLLNKFLVFRDQPDIPPKKEES